MEFIDDEEISELFSRLLEMLRQAGVDHHSNNYHFVYVASGAQYVKNQYLEKPLQSLRHKENEKDHTPQKRFDSDTLLSALFRKSHYEELRRIIEAWRPYLVNDDQTTDALALNTFLFDFDQIRPVNIYMDFARLINHDALLTPMSVLAAYLFKHSNLSKSENSLYVQMKRYRNMCK